MYHWKHLKEASVIVTNFNRLEWLKMCLVSIEAYTRDVDYELVIIDAGSTDGCREYLMQNYQHQATLIFEGRLFSYAQSCNRAMRLCREPYVSLLNNDCTVTAGWLRKAIDKLNSDKQIGHLAHKVLRHDAIRIMSHGANFDIYGNTVIPFINFHRDDPQANQEGNYGYAGFGIYRRDVLEQLGYLPEWPVRIYWDDADNGLRVNALGLDVRYCPESAIIHSMPAEEREGFDQSINVGRKFFMDIWSDFLKENNGFNPSFPKQPTEKPYQNGKHAEIYTGQPFEPLGWAVAEFDIK